MSTNSPELKSWVPLYQNSNHEWLFSLNSNLKYHCTQTNIMSTNLQGTQIMSVAQHKTTEPKYTDSLNSRMIIIQSELNWWNQSWI